MTEHDFELLSRYLDGELPPTESAGLERRLASEPALKDALDTLRQVNASVRAEAHAPGNDRVPAHIAAMLDSKPAADVVPFPSRRGRAGVGLAIAASLVAAVGLWLAPQWRVADTGLHPADARQPQVADALENTPSSAEDWTPLADGGQLRPVLSFAGTDSQWCREYQVSQQREQWRGVACRGEAGAWHTQILVSDSGHPVRGDTYQPAGAGDLDAISDYINDRAASIPLSADEEAALIADDWQ